MKIAFYIGSLSQGGAERVIVNLATYLKGQGHDVVMVNYFIGTNEYELPKDIKRYLVDLEQTELTKSRIANLARRLTKLRKVWKSEKPDVIVSFIGKTNIMTLITSRMLHIPVVVSVRSNPEREYSSRGLRLGMRVMFPYASGIVLQTKLAAEYFPQKLQKKIIILPNSLQPDFVRELYCGERTHEIVSVGRLDQNKNQQMLLEAYYELVKEKRIDAKDWKLVLYGDGPMRSTLETYCTEQNLGDAVQFMGVQKHIADWIQKSAIFVLPSKQEGMPNALIEAMALGLAVISTDCPCGGPAEMIKHNQNGMLIAVDDKSGLKESLLELIESEEKREKLGRTASEIATVLHPDLVNKQWEDYLVEISKKK